MFDYLNSTLGNKLHEVVAIFFSKLTGGRLLEAGISKKSVKKSLIFKLRFRGRDGHLIEHGHLLEFIGYQWKGINLSHSLD